MADDDAVLELDWILDVLNAPPGDPSSGFYSSSTSSSTFSSSSSSFPTPLHTAPSPDADSSLLADDEMA